MILQQKCPGRSDGLLSRCRNQTAIVLEDTQDGWPGQCGPARWWPRAMWRGTAIDNSTDTVHVLYMLFHATCTYTDTHTYTHIAHMPRTPGIAHLLTSSNLKYHPLASSTVHPVFNVLWIRYQAATIKLSDQPFKVMVWWRSPIWRAPWSGMVQGMGLWAWPWQQNGNSIRTN